MGLHSPFHDYVALTPELNSHLSPSVLKVPNPSVVTKALNDQAPRHLCDFLHCAPLPLGSSHSGGFPGP